MREYVKQFIESSEQFRRERELGSLSRMEFSDWICEQMKEFHD